MRALPLSAFFLFLELATGGAIALFLVHLRGEVNRGFTLFTGWILLGSAAVALWLRLSFPPVSPLGDGLLPPVDGLWLGAERALMIVLVVVWAIYLLALQFGRQQLTQPLGTVIPLLALGALWASALVQPSKQLAGLGAPLADLAGALALGSGFVGLSLGHWYLVSPALSTKPLVRITFLCMGALVAQATLAPLLVLLPAGNGTGVEGLLGEYGLFVGVRVVFGFVVPLAIVVATWRTARIRSLDSATGLLYILVALVLTGEIVARTLYFLTGVAT